MTALDLVFLGHQSWWIRHGDVSVLVDPVLGETIGGHTRLAVHPPRSIDVSAIGTVDLIVLSHEHNDHVDLSSLALLDREIPVLVAPLMPAVLVRAIERLGFAVHRSQPEVALTAGGLRLQLLPGGRRAPISEGRVAQILITGEAEDGDVTVLMGVDTVISSHTLQAIRLGELPAPDAVVVANNTQIPPLGARGSARELMGPDPAEGFVGIDLLRELCQDYVAGLPGTPAVVLCGGGFVDTHELGVPYCLDDHPALVALARSLSFGRRVFGPVPGTLLSLHTAADGFQIEETTHPVATLDTARLDALRALPAPVGALPLRSVLPFPAPEQSDAVLARVVRGLDGLVPALLSHDLGVAIVRRHRHAGKWCGPQRLLVRLVCGPDGAGVWWALDLTEARFVPVEEVDVDEIFKDWPFGFEVCLQDLDALMVGELVVWDLLGVALRHWAVEGAGVAAFFCSILGEAARPAATARALARQLVAVGVPTTPADLMGAATEARKPPEGASREN